MKPFKQSTVTVINVLAYLVSTLLVFAMMIALVALNTLEPDANMFESRSALAFGALVVAVIAFGILQLFILYPIFKKYYGVINDKK